MDPMAVDVSAYLDVVLSPDKNQVTDAVGVEVVSQCPMGHARYSRAYLPFDSEVIQSSRCTLMAERLFRGYLVLLVSTQSGRWDLEKSTQRRGL